MSNQSGGDLISQIQNFQFHLSATILETTKALGTNDRDSNQPHVQFIPNNLDPNSEQLKASQIAIEEKANTIFNIVHTCNIEFFFCFLLFFSTVISWTFHHFPLHISLLYVICIHVLNYFY